MVDGYLIYIDNLRNLEAKHYNNLVNGILRHLNIKFNFEYPSQCLNLQNNSRLYMLKLQGKAIKEDKKNIIKSLEKYREEGLEFRIQG